MFEMHGRSIGLRDFVQASMAGFSPTSWAFAILAKLARGIASIDIFNQPEDW